jgi:lactam utilization protein B
VYTKNTTMMRAGYAPAAMVAEHLDKALSTIHRLATSEGIECARDGRALYVKLESLATHYDGQKNAPIASQVRKLLATLAKAADEEDAARSARGAD